MIKINLLQKKNSVGLTSLTSVQGSPVMGVFQKLKDKLSGGSGPQSAMSARNSKLKTQEASKKVLIMLGIVSLASYLAYDYLEKMKAEKIAEVDAVISKQQEVIAKLDKEIAERSSYENYKKKIEADEKAVRTKIEVIKKLLDERPTIAKLLIALGQATPKDVWVTSFQWQDTSITISGNSIGTVVVTEFVKNLEESIFFKDVNLNNMRQARDKGLDIASFELGAKKK